MKKNRILIVLLAVCLAAVLFPVCVPAEAAQSESVLAGNLIISPVEDQVIQVQVGETVTLKLDAAPDADAFRWFVDRNDGEGFVAIEDVSGAEYTTPALSEDDNGCNYYCLVMAGTEVQFSPLFTLRVGSVAAMQPGRGNGNQLMMFVIALILAVAGMMMTARMRIKED